MADKQVPLSIVLRTVDKATAGIQAVNHKLDAITKPTREFGKALSELGEKSGFNAVRDGFKEVGGAVKETLFKVLEVGLVIGEATHLVLELVDSFAKLGHTAQRAGVETDFLAGMRYAAGKSGVAVDMLDAGLTTLTQNMGQAKAGTGRMLKFLQQVSPVLAHQVTKAHSTAEALGLLADAMAKLPDPARRAALAQKTLGDSALAPLLAKGSKGIQELMTAYAKLAPGQGEAAKSALEVEDAMVDLHASTDGVKAALVSGLSPAIKQVVDKMTEWLVAHQEDVRNWADDIGKKLPAAVDEVVHSISAAIKDVAGFVDAIGGWKVAAGALAVVMAGPLIQAVVALGGALLTTPVGVVITGLAAIAAGISAITSETKEFKTFVDKEAATGPTVAFHGGIPYDAKQEAEYQDNIKQMHLQARRAQIAMVEGKSVSDVAREEIETDEATFQRRADRASLVASGANPADLPLLPTSNFVPPTSTVREGPPTKLTVEFVNAPKGMRSKVTESRGGPAVDMTTGYQMGAP